MSIQDIRAYVALGEQLALGGQPSQEQLAQLREDGFEHVINLGLSNQAYWTSSYRCATAPGTGGHSRGPWAPRHDKGTGPRYACPCRARLSASDPRGRFEAGHVVGVDIAFKAGHGAGTSAGAVQIRNLSITTSEP